MTPAFRIVEGAEYLYLAATPAGCRGQRYRVLRVDVLAVPANQYQVLVEALTGPDRGLWFVCSPWNFSMRYTPAPVEAPPTPPAEAPPPIPEKAAGPPETGR